MRTGRNLWLPLLAGLCLLLTQTQAQRQPGAVRFRHYKGNTEIVDAIFTGMDATNVSSSVVQVRQFRMTAIRDNQDTNVALIAVAPECRLNHGKNTGSAGDAGPIQIYTPTTNLYVEGVGFFISETNQMLIISNQVETRVARSMLRSSPLFGAATNGTENGDQVVHIFSDRMQYDFHSNVVDYMGHVRVVDPGFQMTSPLLTVHLGSNQTVTMMFAREGVTLSPTDRGTATGAEAHYYATNGITFLDLLGSAATDAEWRNGDQEAKGHRFTYRPDLHFLTGDERVRVQWPNPRTNDGAPQTYRELEHADHVDLQMTPDGGAIDGLIALGNVSLTNQADQSRATGGKAVYSRTNDSFVLTETPEWRTAQMDVTGDVLSAAISNNVYHAHGSARVKLHVTSASAGGGQPASTNQWLEVTADDVVDEPEDQRGSRVTFQNNVHGILRDGDAMLDDLTAQTLLVHQNALRQLETVEARGEVRGKTAVDDKGVKKTIECGVLTAKCDPATGRWREVTAEEGAVLAEFSEGPGGVSNVLNARTVTTHFSAVTNQLESGVADGSVVFNQTKPGSYLHATGDRALYATMPEETVELMGRPFVETEKGSNQGADRLKYYLKSGEVESFGRYHIVPRAKEAITTNTPAARKHS